MSAVRSAPDQRLSAGTPSASARRTDIQGMRGLAVLIVVLFHAEVVGFRGGFVGVDVFFVLSGFVITRLLERELLSTGAVDFRRFYRRRVRRLLPASALLLTVVAGLSVLLLSPLGPQQTTAATGTFASLFSANAYLYVSPAGYFDAPALLNPLLHMWSLAVEEQFYLVYPLVLMLTWRLSSRFVPTGNPDRVRRWVVGALVLMGVGSFVLSHVVSYASSPVLGIQSPTQLAFYASPVRAWEFIAGALLAFGTGLVRSMPARLERGLGLCGLGLVVVATLTLDETVPWPGRAALLPVVGTVLMIAGGTRGEGPAATALSFRPLVVLGDLSYSWYLWHWPAIVMARSLFPESSAAVGVAAVASLGPSLMSYHRVEEPVRHADWIRGRRVVLLAGACIVVPILAFAGLRLGAERNWGIDDIDAVQEFDQLHLDQALGCGSVTVADPGVCRFPAGADAASSERIVLIGDSIAGQYSEAMVAAATDLGRPLDIVTRQGCPFVPLDFAANSLASCERFVSTSIEQLLAEPPAVVVLASAIDGYLREDIAWRAFGSSAHATSEAGKAELWADAWQPMLSSLETAGTRVIVIAPNPRFDGWFLAACPTSRLAIDVASCGRSAARQELLDARAEAGVVIERALVGTEASVLDFFDELCPGPICTTNDDDWFRFRDGVHLSVPATIELAPEFIEPLEAELSAPAR